MTAIITINGKRVLGSKVLVGGTKNIDKKPNANIDGPVEVQTNTYENLTLTLQRVKFPFTTTDLANTALFNYSDLLDMYKHKYTGSNKYTLVVTFGKDVDYTLAGLDSTSGIPVVLKSFSMPIDIQDTLNAYQPEVNIILSETE